jgi:hypothetical protein
VPVVAANHPPQPVVSGRLNEIQRTSARIEAMETASCFADFSPGHESPGILFHGLIGLAHRHVRRQDRRESEQDQAASQKQDGTGRGCYELNIAAVLQDVTFSWRPHSRRRRSGQYSDDTEPENMRAAMATITTSADRADSAICSA